MIPVARTYKVTFEYRPGHNVIRAVEYVIAPTKQLALWNAREQRHGCIIADPDCISEKVSLQRKPNMCRR
jgi:hypothetical protein